MVLDVWALEVFLCLVVPTVSTGTGTRSHAQQCSCHPLHTCLLYVCLCVCVYLVACRRLIHRCTGKT